MGRTLFFTFLLYFISSFSGSLSATEVASGLSGKTILLGGASSWGEVRVRSNICEAQRIRPYSALVLSAGDSFIRPGSVALVPDLALSFDEGKPGFFRDSAGNYRVIVSPALEASDRRWARAGTAAALFSEGKNRVPPAPLSYAPLKIEYGSRDALFSPGKRINDFSIEFWLYPLLLENGEQIFIWDATLPQAGSSLQFIKCYAEKNRLTWSFRNFFISPLLSAGSSPHAATSLDSINIELSGYTPVVPKTWSHHVIRFDSGTGMIEYVVDGVIQTIGYATLSGRESGDVYTPLIGQGGSFSIGSHFTGLMDEFRIYGSASSQASLQKFPRSGRMETHVIDLGEGDNGIFRVDARGGRTSLEAVRGSIESRENGRFRFADDSEMQFFIRTAVNPYIWENSRWIPFTPGTLLPENVRGRYVQVAVDFYPSSDGECSPYLEEIRINYIPSEAPPPPSAVLAAAADGMVQIRWRSSADMETDGYLVYYGTKKGEYFGEGAILGVSPIDAGKHNSLFIDGLENSVLYFFTVAAYKRDRNSGMLQIGEFSREVSARPLEGL